MSIYGNIGVESRVRIGGIESPIEDDRWFDWGLEQGTFTEGPSWVSNSLCRSFFLAHEAPSSPVRQARPAGRPFPAAADDADDGAPPNSLPLGPLPSILLPLLPYMDV